MKGSLLMWRHAGLAVLMLISLCACAVTGGGSGKELGFQPLPVKGYDHKYMLNEGGWLDKHRMIFSVRAVRPGMKDDGQPESYEKEWTIAVWDTRRNEVTLHMKGTVFCVNPEDGYVQININQHDSFGNAVGRPPWRMLYGKWGETLQEYAYYPPSRDNSHSHYINQFSCHHYAGNANDLVPNHYVLPLHETHGIVYVPFQQAGALYETYGYL